MSSPEDSWPLPLEDEMAATDARLREITPSQINYASPEVEQAYVRARTLLTDRLLGQVTELQDQVSVYGESATLGLDQIAPLEGLLPEEDIQALRADFQSRLERAVAFFNE
ncbi:MAG TPA: hypothetical protein VFW90_03470, partial [Candidatus Saccharimonadales bacterium]|nr:hypothetical protein [Candidatus Saccharimonadales bacterium]